MTRTLDPQRIRWLVFLLTAAACFAATDAVLAEDATPGDGPYGKIMVVDFEGEIGAMTWAYMKRRIERVKAEEFDCLVLRIDSPGGTVFHSEKIADALFDLEDIHTVAWVPEQAISGACMVAVACNEIVMDRSATMGDCQPIFIASGGGGYQEAGEKIESPLRAIFRKYAEQNGYPIALAEAFVSKNIRVIEVEASSDGSRHFVSQEAYEGAEDRDIVFASYPKEDLRRLGPPVVTDKQLLTLTAREAKRFGFVKRAFPGHEFPTDEEMVLRSLRRPGATVVQEAPTFFEQAGKVMFAIAGVLAAVVALSVMITLFQGFGTISIIGGCALVVMLLINATADQLYGFPIFLIIVGALLLATEAYIIPGFGVAGILGFLSLGAGFLFLATGSGFGETTGRLTDEAILRFAMQFIVSVVAGFATILLLSRFFPVLGPGKKMMLASPDGSTTVTEAMNTRLPAVGDVGFSSSPLRPAGSAEFSGELVDVVSHGEFIDAGVRLKVIAVEGAQVTVAPDGA